MSQPKNNHHTIFVLATDIKKEKGEPFKFLKKDEKNRALDNGFRLKATKYLLVNDEVKKIILIGGRNKKLRKFRTEIMEEYLKALMPDYKHYKSKITQRICCPGNSCGNIIEIFKHIKENNLFRASLGVISNLYHLPRLKELIRVYKKDHPKYKNTNIDLIVAENVIVDKNEQKEINKFYKSKAMKERIKSEKKGISELKKGNYNVYWQSIIRHNKKDYRVLF